MPSEWVAIQRNPRSGSGPKARVLRELIAELKRRDLRPWMFSRRERLAQVLKNAERRAALRCIVAAGGDGTVGDVINRYPGCAMTVCPLGTENLFAKFLGIPRCGRRLAEWIALGNTRTLDVGELTSSVENSHPVEKGQRVPQIVRRFLIVASVGFDADVVHRTHARRTGHIRKWHYVVRLLQSLRRYRYPRLRIHVTDDGEPRNAVLAVASNLPAYAMQLPVASSSVGDDGLLDVRLFEWASRWNMLRYFWTVWRGRHETLPDVHAFRTTSLRIDSDVSAPIQIDGDPAGFTPAAIRVLPGALTVLVPPQDSQRNR